MLMHFLPARVRCRESQAQYALNPARCQRTTVSGWTKINACCHPDQNRFSTTQNYRSKIANRGCGCLRFQTESCCRRARFSSSKLRRERKCWIARIDKSLNRRSIIPVYRTSSQAEHFSHLTDLKIDRYFGEAHHNNTVCPHRAYEIWHGFTEPLLHLEAAPHSSRSRL